MRDRLDSKADQKDGKDRQTSVGPSSDWELELSRGTEVPAGFGAHFRANPPGRRAGWRLFVQGAQRQ